MEPSNRHARRDLAWIPPLVVLAAICLALSLTLYRLSGGGEVADDALRLADFVRKPFALWGDYRAAGFSDTWGSFPPLLPPLFGMLVAPWLAALPDFIGFRMGVLTWSIAAFLALHLILVHTGRAPAPQRRAALWLFALLPSVIGAASFIPQEEIYVSLFVLVLYLAARSGRRGLILPLLVLTMLAGKYFLLVLAAPLAFSGDRPWRRLVTWGAACAAILTAYIGYHRILFGLSPVIGHIIDPAASLSIWALMWNVGLRPDPHVIRIASLVLTGGLVLLLAWRCRASRIPLPFAMATALYVTLLCLSITFPAYVLWAVPLSLVCFALTGERRLRIWMIAMLFLWGFGEWGANFFRGVRLALETDRAAGKTALAAAAERFLGTNFPYETVHLACIAAVIASGIGMIVVLWRAGKPGALRQAQAAQ